MTKPLIEQKFDAKELVFGALNPNTHVCYMHANASKYDYFEKILIIQKTKYYC